MWAKDLMKEATRAVQLGKSWPDESPCKEELGLLRVSSGIALENCHHGLVDLVPLLEQPLRSFVRGGLRVLRKYRKSTRLGNGVEAEEQGWTRVTARKTRNQELQNSKVGEGVNALNPNEEIWITTGCGASKHVVSDQLPLQFEVKPYGVECST